MRDRNIKKQEEVENVLSMLSEHSDILFDYAPVMMHAIDKSCRLVKVNRRWLETLGDRKNEVLAGSPSTSWPRNHGSEQ